MISTRLFRLYRLALPAANSASAAFSKKLLEPISRRVAVSSPNGASSNPLVRSWVARYCTSATDKDGDVSVAEEAPVVETANATLEVVAADTEVTTDGAHPIDVGDTLAIDEPPAEAKCDDSPSSSPSPLPSGPLKETIDTTPSINSIESPESASVRSNDHAPPPPPAVDTSADATPPPPPSTSAASAGLHVHVLSDRALIRIEGSDTRVLLQGLVTQDLELLNQTTSVYAMMLNLQGRVLYEVIIYNASSPRSEIQKYLLECDAAVASDIVSHLKKYKLRKDCDIVDVSDIYEVSSVQPTTERMTGISSLPRKSEFAEAFDPILIACRDPRLKDIGWRLISGKGFEVSEALGGGAVSRPLIEYRERRYKLGVAEGIGDLEPGKTFPLESNLVFLNGVSFSKGCYLGQELTARTHHTGVIRKRIMPLILSAPASSDLGPFPGNLILNTAGKDAGKFRDAVGVHGIGLVRVNMSGGRLIVVGKGKESECYARMPNWWPVDDPAAVLGEEEEDPVEEAAGEQSA